MKRTVSVSAPKVTAAFPLACHASKCIGTIGASSDSPVSIVVQADASMKISATPDRDSRRLCGANGD
jgi:hypothetical protein